VEAFRAYGLQIIIGLIALLGIWKDWSESKKRPKKRGKLIYASLFLLTVFLMILSIADTRSIRARAAKDRRDAASEKQTADAHIQFLTDQVGQLREDSKANSDGFRKSFDGLYQRFTDLKAKVTNADLIREIDDTKKELRATQAKLVTPKPTLVPSLYVPNYPYLSPVLESDSLRSPSGSVAVEFVITNTSNVSALRGDISLRICDLCRYAKEPEGFVKTNGALDSDRGKEFQHILANSTIEKMTAEIIVPLNVTRFEIDVYIVCENCDTKRQALFVNVK
jgi:hypothetical protein